MSHKQGNHFLITASDCGSLLGALVKHLSHNAIVLNTVVFLTIILPCNHISQRQPTVL